MFIQYDSYQANAGCLCHCRRSQLGAGGLSVARYQVQTQLRCGTSGFEGLSKMKQRVKIGRHVGMRIQIPEINDALRRCVGTAFDELVPVIYRSRSQGISIVPIELEMVSRSDGAASAPKFAQP